VRLTCWAGLCLALLVVNGVAVLGHGGMGKPRPVRWSLSPGRLALSLLLAEGVLAASGCLVALVGG
jgi:hypothetical protein